MTMQFAFGPGNIIATPLSDAYGNVIAVPTPRRLGVFQECSFDSSAENKLLFGANQMPVAVGRGKGKTNLKIKAAQISIDQYNALFIGQPANLATQIVSAVVDTVGIVIPATPFTVTLADAITTPLTQMLIPNTGTFTRDLGVSDSNGNAFTAVLAAPATTQYEVVAGVYTFAAADVGKRVFISFAYTAASTTAKSLMVANVPMGGAPLLMVDFVMSFGGNTLYITLFQSIAGKASFATKLDDFAPMDFELDGFANPAGNIYQISGSQ